MMKVILAFAMLALLLIAGGCMDYEEAMVINADGSGTLKMHYALSKVYMDQMDAMMESMGAEEVEGEGQEESNPADEMFSREEIEAALAGNDKGIKLESFESSENDEAYVWDMEFSFENMEDLGYLTQAMASDPDDQVGLGQDNQTYTKQDDGTWLYSRTLGEEEPAEMYESEDVDQQEYDEYEYEEEEAPAESHEGEESPELEGDEGDFADAMGGMSEQMQMMAEEMSKHKIRVIVTFPGKVLESNATRIDGNTATWEYSLQEMSGPAPKLTAKVSP